MVEASVQPPDGANGPLLEFTARMYLREDEFAGELLPA